MRVVYPRFGRYTCVAVWNLWNQPIDGGAPKPVTSFASGDIFDFAWSSESRQLAVARGAVTSDAVLVSNLTPAVR